MLDRRTRHIEVTKDICLERALELFISNIADRFLMMLICSVVNKYVELAKFAHRFFDSLFAERAIAHIACYQVSTSTFTFNELRSFFCVDLFFGKIDDRYV